MFAFLLAAATSKVFIQLNEERSFIHWMRTNNQFYTGDEYHFRLGLYLCRTRWINDFNKGQHTFTVGHNKFSTYTPSEYRSLLGARPSNLKSRQKNAIIAVPEKLNADVPDTFDWREKNVVNSVKDQQNCGSCWSFSAVSTCESAYAIKYGMLLRFSEQNINDCDPLSQGCGGGAPFTGINYIVYHQGGKFLSEEDCPYTATNNKCWFDESKGIGSVSGYIATKTGIERDLKDKVATYGVASVTIDADNSLFQSYTGGIQDNPYCTGSPNHAVNVVGYGTEGGVDYWLVRNSWGTSWGEEGYIRMHRNAQNQCSIASEAIIAQP